MENNIIPPVRPYFLDYDLKDASRGFIQILESGMLSHANCKNIQEFEQLNRELAGTKYAVAVNNGTTALQSHWGSVKRRFLFQ
jgi:dTDP-4-amino-4,6-dideoxygalactose transaminase